MRQPILFSGSGGGAEAARIENTYHVSGRLEKDVSTDMHLIFNRRHISCEIEALNPQAAADHFETDGWKWIKQPAIRRVSEAVKMERAGQPSLFALDEVD